MDLTIYNESEHVTTANQLKKEGYTLADYDEYFMREIWTDKNGREITLQFVGE